MIALRAGRIALLAAMAVAVTSACSSGPGLPPFDGNIALGTWGGDSAGMIVSDTAMHLHIACTYGDVSGRVPVSTDGTFDMSGTYMLRAYPVAVGPAMPAQFVGRLDGSQVTVTVTVNDTIAHQTVIRGPVVVVYGENPHLGPCPICRRPIVTRRSRIRNLLLGTRRALHGTVPFRVSETAEARVRYIMPSPFAGETSAGTTWLLHNVPTPGRPR